MFRANDIPTEKILEFQSKTQLFRMDGVQRHTKKPCLPSFCPAIWALTSGAFVWWSSFLYFLMQKKTQKPKLLSLLSGIPTARGYNAPCSENVVHNFVGSVLMRWDNEDRKDKMETAENSV